jgi:hypothetical protein
MTNRNLATQMSKMITDSVLELPSYRRGRETEVYCAVLSDVYRTVEYAKEEARLEAPRLSKRDRQSLEFIEGWIAEFIKDHRNQFHGDVAELLNSIRRRVAEVLNG